MKKAIKSVLSQSHTNIEYLIVDGNSSDNTLEVAKSFTPDFTATEQIADGVDGIICENSDEGVYTGIKNIIKNPEVLADFKKELSEGNCDNSEKIEKLYSLWKDKM